MVSGMSEPPYSPTPENSPNWNNPGTPGPGQAGAPPPPGYPQPYPGQPGAPPPPGYPQPYPGQPGAPLPPGYPQPYPGQPGAAGVAKKPFYKRRWFLIAVPLVIVLAIVGVLFSNRATGYELGSALKSALLKEPGVNSVDNVHCPGSVNTDKGHTYTCQATLNGKPFDLNVRFDADRHFLVTGATQAGGSSASAAAPSATVSVAAPSSAISTPAGSAPSIAAACHQILPTIKAAATGTSGAAVADQLTTEVAGVNNPDLTTAVIALAQQFRSISAGQTPDVAAIRTNAATIGRICAQNGVTS